jgi:hypothetical protein
LAVSGPVDCEPLVGSLPDQAPEAEHEVAFHERHLRFELDPFATVLGDPLMLTLGAFDFTERVVD